MARGEPIRRVLSVLLALDRAPQGRRAAELAVQLDLSVRTVHRAFQTLEETGFPLLSTLEGRERRWRLTSVVKRSPSFTSGEALALLWAERGISPGLRDTVLAHPLQAASRKVRSMLPAEAADRLLALAEREVGLPGPHHDYSKRDVVIAALRRAVQSRTTVHMRYASAREKPRPRAVDPLALVTHAGALYVVGFCHRRKAVRTFLVDRIRSTTLTHQSFKPVPGFRIDAYFEGSYGVYRGRSTAVRLRFDPSVSDLAAERIWHRSQKLRALLDGSTELTLQVAPTPDLVATVLSFGRHVQVLAPRALAETVAEEWFAAASQSRKSLVGSKMDVGPDVTRVGSRVIRVNGKRSGERR